MSSSIDLMISYENGKLDEQQTTDFFQSIINTGEVWNLQGSYGRTAKFLIDIGRCTSAPVTPKTT